jgi:hypothetical protein
VGTGFFVLNGDEAVTNVHVALSKDYVDVLLKDGKRYHTQIVKLDARNDLALLQIDEIPADPKHALKPDTTPLKLGEELITFGHPDGAPDIWASPGVYKGKDSLQNLVPQPESFPDMKALKDLESSPDPFTAEEARQYLEAERLHQRTNIHNGNSGSPTFDLAGHLRGVAANRLSSAHALFIGADKVEALLSTAESKFKFNYQTDDQGNHKLVSVSRLDGSTAPPIFLKMPERHASVYDLEHRAIESARFQLGYSISRGQLLELLEPET